jgi:hypothetical protein
MNEQKIPNVVVIPTRDHAETYCANLIKQLLDQNEVDKLFIYDNRTTREGGKTNLECVAHWPHEDYYKKVVWRHTPSMSITQMWNHGWGSACVFGLAGPVNIAFLNDDLTIPHNFISILADRLHRDSSQPWLVCPDWTRHIDEGDESRFFANRRVRGTFREGGMCGWAFMIRGELLGQPLPPMDEQFLYWCGDDDLVKQIELYGGECHLISGLPIDHVGTATGTLHPELQDIGWADLKRFQEKYS